MYPTLSWKHYKKNICFLCLKHVFLLKKTLPNKNSSRSGFCFRYIVYIYILLISYDKLSISVNNIQEYSIFIHNNHSHVVLLSIDLSIND